ncbi:MAG: sulfotransferase [Myxococcales bacterium]|nr:sulfotransferase [Myxococcales bacterium]
MAEDIRILDLADPQLPQSFIDQSKLAAPIADAMQLELDALMEQASRETGLTDFGELDWQERLEIILTGLREDGPLTAIGKLSSIAQLVGFLKNRLLLEDLWKRHPEIEQVEQEPPIIIAGLPRSGTTHLHSMIGADPKIRSLPWWESLEPVLAESEVPLPGEEDPRFARAAAGIAFRDSVMPHFNAMHEMTVDHIHEEIHLLAIDFSTMIMETLGIGRAPRFRDYYLEHDQTPHYRYLAKILRTLQWLRGGTRWVLKSPQHLEQLKPIAAVFPGATLVVTHRDPVATVASFSTMIAYASRLSAAKADPVGLGHYWADRIEKMLQRCVEDRDTFAADSSIDVLFHDYMGRELETVDEIYRLAGVPFDSDSKAALVGYHDDHPRGRYGRVRYNLADFNLNAKELRERFRFYTDRFPVRLES